MSGRRRQVDDRDRIAWSDIKTGHRQLSKSADVVIVDGAQHAGHVGSLLRQMSDFGLQALFLTNSVHDTSSPSPAYPRSFVKEAMWVSMARHEDEFPSKLCVLESGGPKELLELLTFLKDHGFCILACENLEVFEETNAARNRAQEPLPPMLYHALGDETSQLRNLKQPLAFLFGEFGSLLHPVLAQCDAGVYIPIRAAHPKSRTMAMKPSESDNSMEHPMPLSVGHCCQELRPEEVQNSSESSMRFTSNGQYGGYKEASLRSPTAIWGTGSCDLSDAAIVLRERFRLKSEVSEAKTAETLDQHMSNEEDVVDYRVILWYKHCKIKDRSLFRDDQEQLCRRLGLAGRIRVGEDGVNGCLGGCRENLERYIDQFSFNADEHNLDTYGCKFSGIHWNWGELDYTRGDFNQQKLKGLSVRLCKEVVSLFGNCYSNAQNAGKSKQRKASLQQETLQNQIAFYKRLFESSECEATFFSSKELEQTTASADPDDSGLHAGALTQNFRFQPGQHLSPKEFHDVLSTAASNQDVLLFDARNVYETNIGTFSAPGCQLIDPKTRQFTDIPRYLVERREDLVAAAQGKKVLMYCTGGVRCERASQLLRLVLENDASSTVKAPAEKLEIYQLQGGINNYLEQFPSDRGGFFHGRNFQFDERMSVPASSNVDAPKLGRCNTCECLWDDYASADARCSRCRMRILLCTDCRHSGDPETKLLCELCRQK